MKLIAWPRIILGILLALMLLSENAVAGQRYKVQRGDTLSRISSKTGISVAGLRKINNLSTTRLKIGQTLALAKEQKKTKITEAPSGQITVSLTDDKRNLESEKADINPPTRSDVPTKNEAAILDDEETRMLSKWANPNEQQLLVKVALAFLDAPYRLGGSSVRGIDCSGFVKKVYSLFGINLPRTAAEQSHVGLEVAKSSLTEGDLIFFNEKSRIGHVGIYIGENKFVHAASTNKGVRVDSLDSSYYKKHYKRAVRLKTKEDAT